MNMRTKSTNNTFVIQNTQNDGEGTTENDNNNVLRKKNKNWFSY